jgi:hypothetical protein
MVLANKADVAFDAITEKEISDFMIANNITLFK